MNILVAYGDEPYKVELLKQKYQANLSYPDFNCSILYGVFDDKVLDLINTMPFMDERRAVILTVDTLKDLDNKAFFSLLENPVSSTDLLVVVRNYDNRLKIAKMLAKRKISMPCNKFENVSEFASAVKRECSLINVKISDTAITALEKRTGYLEFDAANFLDVLDWLRKLAAISGEITASMIADMVPLKEEPNVFALAILIRDGKYDALQKEISLLNEDDAIRVLSLLQREYRIGIKASWFSYADIGIRNATLGKLSESSLLKGLSILTDAIAKVKSGTLPSSIALKYAVAGLIAS